MIGINKRPCCVCKIEGVWLWKRRQDGKRTKEHAVIDPFFSQRPCEQETLCKCRCNSRSHVIIGPTLPLCSWTALTVLLFVSSSTWKLKQSITFNTSWHLFLTFFVCGSLYIKDQTCNFLQIYRHVCCILLKYCDSATMTNWMKKKSQCTFNKGPLLK